MSEIDEALAMVDHIADHPEAMLAEAIGGLTATGHVVETIEEGWAYRVDDRMMSPGDVFVEARRIGLIASLIHRH